MRKTYIDVTEKERLKRARRAVNLINNGNGTKKWLAVFMAILTLVLVWLKLNQTVL